jgi:hypothetical protein
MYLSIYSLYTGLARKIQLVIGEKTTQTQYIDLKISLLLYIFFVLFNKESEPRAIKQHTYFNVMFCETFEQLRYHQVNN